MIQDFLSGNQSTSDNNNSHPEGLKTQIRRDLFLVVYEHM